MAANLSFAIDNVSLGLYSAAANSTAGNLMISPLSIMYASVLLYLGSRGATQKNLYDSLALNEAFGSKDMDPSAVAGAFGDAMSKFKLSSLRPPGPKGKNGTAGSPKNKTVAQTDSFQLALANGVFVQDTLEFDKEFLSTVSKELKATVRPTNFLKNPEKAAKDISKWAEDRTGGKIKNLIPVGALDSSTAAVLANAVYFKAAWKNLFNSSLTKNGTFHLLDGKPAMTKFMTKRQKYLYNQNKALDIQYLEIPYDNDEAAMLVLLPNKNDGLRDLEKKLTPGILRDLGTVNATRREVDVRLPKFRMASNFDLAELMQKIGINDVFTENADLSAMVPSGGIQVSSAFHKTFIGKFTKKATATKFGKNAFVSLS